MSLEDKMRRARRQIKKRDAAQTREEQIKRNEAHERVVAAQSLSRAQQRAAQAPPIKSTGEDSLKTGDADLEVQNDNGYGTHIESPGYRCPEKGCVAAFHNPERLATHTSFYHGPADQLFG